MSAVMSHSVADYTATELRSIDEIDAAIVRLVRHMNTECYQMLVLVRELDDRFGWKQWGYKMCAEWLAWRSDISVGGARAGAHGACAALVARDLGGVCRRPADLHQSQGAHARRRSSSGRLAAGLCARDDGRERRGALPADSQCRAGLGP